MKLILTRLFSLLSFIFLPAILQAEEPSNGTLIMISSIGGWFILWSLFIYLRRIIKPF
jgi:hypothetical protein